MTPLADLGAFDETLERTADLLNRARVRWMVVGGAAMVLHGLEQGPVADIDIILPAVDAGELADRYCWQNHADTRSARFRSELRLQPELGPVPVDLLGGFRIRGGDGWVSVQPGETRRVRVGAQPVFLPTLPRLAHLFWLCGREKDLRRAALIAGD